MDFRRQIDRFKPDKLRSVARCIRSLVSAAERRDRLARSVTDDRLAAFWRDHGREWGLQQASTEDLQRLRSLADGVARLDESKASAKVVAELKSIWSACFPNPVDALGWDDMNDQLPASAMVAFVKGAGEAWTARQEPS